MSVPLDSPIPDGAPLIALLRPEDMALGAGPGWDGEVRSCVPRGGSFALELDTAAGLLLIHADEPAAPGEHLRAAPRPGRAKIYPA